MRGDEVRRDKARGSLFGLALGDCLGSPFEGIADVSDADIVAVERDRTPLRHTDDTALALVLARHLAHRRSPGATDATALDHDGLDHDGLDQDSLDQDVLARELAEAWRAEPWRGYGGGVVRTFELIVAGTPWRQATRAVFAQGSFGNGGAMRVAPVALAGAGLDAVADLARRSAEVTHAHADA
ncbi:ADP-ribosylglycohydrolase family protein, partial [Saccharomonospora saliphila]|uniref:ADP-ribosylglycohydrolase family protein n=1 Tax=Saccharomonospora saliphila TaxID=369829 RepID=UPI000375453A